MQGSRLVVLASGHGTNLQAIIDACAEGRLPATVAAVVSDQADAHALVRDGDAGIPAVHVGRHPGEPGCGVQRAQGRLGGPGPHRLAGMAVLQVDDGRRLRQQRVQVRRR